MPPVQIIGFGNMQRGDDAAGLLVAHRLQEQHIPAREASAELLSLMTEWDVDEPLVLVDAALANAEPGDILRFRAEDLPRHARELRFSTHGLGLADLVGMAGALGRLPREVAILGIAGSQFGIGDRTSRPVLSAIETLVGELAAAWRDWDETTMEKLCPKPTPTHVEEDAPGP